MGQIVPVIECEKREIPNMDYDDLIKQDPTGKSIDRQLENQPKTTCYGFWASGYPEGEIAIIGNVVELIDYAGSADVAASIIQRKIDNTMTLTDQRDELTEKALTLTRIATGLRQGIEYYANLKQQNTPNAIPRN